MVTTRDENVTVKTSGRFNPNTARRKLGIIVWSLNTAWNTGKEKY